MWYNPDAHTVGVAIYDSVNGWQTHGSASLTLAAGDLFGAVATDDGQVWVFKNDELVLKVDKSAWAYASEDGYVGLGSYEGQYLDDFGGGSSGQMLSFQLPLGDLTLAALDWLGGSGQGQKPNPGPGIDISRRPSHAAKARGAGNAMWEEWRAWRKTRRPSNPAAPAPVQVEIPTLEPTLTETPTSTPEQYPGEIPIPEPLEESASSDYSAGLSPSTSLGQRRLASLAPARSLSLAPLLEGVASFFRNPFAETGAVSSYGGHEEVLTGSVLQTIPETVTITYAYDPLNRLTAADYSDGRSFGYEYDAVSDVLTYTKTIEGQTTLTNYTYDDAHELLTSQENGQGTTWHYTYDARGSLVEITPGEQPASGAKRYSYNTAGYLVEVESHDGSGYQPQAEMVYNGLGERLQMTGYAEGLGTTTHYLLDTLRDARPVLAEADGQVTSYVYGLNLIGEAKEGWSFYLYDGLNSVRQVSDPQGAIRLASSFTPWGDLLELSGEGGLGYGYLGGMLDAATGLIYLGDGQYYDPSSGRFLSRDTLPNRANPYVPWNGDPFGSMMGPLALLILLRLRKRKKNGEIDRILLAALLLLAIGMAGMSLAACTTPTQPPTTVPPAMPPGGTGTPEPSPTSNPMPTGTPRPPTETPTVPAECKTPPPTGMLIGEFYLSAYYIPTEDQYTTSAKVPIPATENKKIELGYPKDAEVYLSSAGPHFYNNLGPDHYQYARWSFLYDDVGICMQGTGKLENGRYISCTAPQGTPWEDIGFEWQLDEKVNRLENSVREFETVAVCPTFLNTGLSYGEEIEIPDLATDMQNFHADTSFSIMDVGEKLCKATRGVEYETFDLFVGEGQEGLKAFLKLHPNFDRLYKVYRR